MGNIARCLPSPSLRPPFPSFFFPSYFPCVSSFRLWEECARLPCPPAHSTWTPPKCHTLYSFHALALIHNNLQLKAPVHSHVQLFFTLWTIVCQSPLSMEFSRQEYWMGGSALLQGIFPTQGSNPCLLDVSCIARQVLHHWATWEAPRPRKSHDL